MSALPDASPQRRLYMVLSPRALAYARLALSSLLENAVEPLHLTLITDSAEDKQELQQVLSELPLRRTHTAKVHSESDLADAEADRFRNLPNLRAFRHGHPCWRKITDPLLLSHAGEEIILLDPDLYFPNPFTFESTPADGLVLMWQQPNCLWPPEIVQRALDAGIPLARHVDIGVSHWRGEVDLEWLDWLLATLGGAALPRAMHIEAVVWSALAMRVGGGHLDPASWVCWRRTQSKRVRVKLGHPGAAILSSEPWSRMKCFHAGGEAKWWLEPALRERHTPAQPQTIPSPLLPYVQLTAGRYACEQGAKKLLRSLGYHRLLNSGAQ
jgi:hypothetical protein